MTSISAALGNWLQLPRVPADEERIWIVVWLGGGVSEVADIGEPIVGVGDDSSVLSADAAQFLRRSWALWDGTASRWQSLRCKLDRRCGFPECS